MAEKKYRVTLTDAEREQPSSIINRSNHSAQKRKRAQALLLADQGYTDEMIAERVGMHRRGIEGIRERFVEEGFEATVEGKERGHRQRSIQREDEARLIALVCGPVPEGYAHWT
ncbi:MAG: helix-turn-helix domain-containing protein, partial [Treponema sp.]|nr:helix-turn-helix domain-containing protein [Treponema sp.]